MIEVVAVFAASMGCEPDESNAALFAVSQPLG